MSLPTKRLTIWKNLALNAYWIGLSIKWNSIGLIILPAVMRNFVPDSQKATYLGLLTFAGMVIATIVQPAAGAISDDLSTRWGRRRPLMVLGTAFDLVFLAVLGWAGGLVWLAAGYILLQLSSNIAHGPAQGLLPDLVPPERLGEAAGLKTLMDMGGLVVASLVMGQTLKPGETRPVLSIAIVMVVVLVSTAVTVLFVHEPAPDRHTRTLRLSKRLRETFNIDFRANTAYWWLISSRFAFLLGVTGIQAFAQYYISDVFPSENPIALTGNLLAALTVTLILCAVAGGWLGDRYGHKRILYAASALSAAGCLLLLAARTPLLLLLFGSVLGGGVGLFLTSNWTLSNQMAPQNEAGKYLGFTNLATAGSSAIARLFGPAIDALNNLRAGGLLGWIFLFVVGAVCVSASALLLLKVDLRQRQVQGQQI